MVLAGMTQRRPDHQLSRNVGFDFMVSALQLYVPDVASRLVANFGNNPMTPNSTSPKASGALTSERMMNGAMTPALEYGAGSTPAGNVTPNAASNLSLSVTGS